MASTTTRPQLYRVATADTCYSESSLETVQEIEDPRDSISTFDTYLDSPSPSSTYSTSPGTPSSLQTTFTTPDEPWHKTGQSYQASGIPANDWGYDLHHAESRQSDSSSLKPKSVKSSKGFGFSKKKSASDLAPSMAQLEAFKLRSSYRALPLHPMPLTMNQLDILRAREGNHPAYTSRQQASHPSRLASLARFGHKEQVTGAVKLVIRKKSDGGDEADGGEDLDAESIYTTITTTSSSSGGSDIVPVYGRGGAGRAAGAKVTTHTYGSVDDLGSRQGMPSMEELQYLDALRLEQSRGSSGSGTSGGKAFLGRLQRKLGSGSNFSQQTDDGSSGSNSISGRGGDPPPHHSSNLRNLAPTGMASRDSLATIHSSPVSQVAESARVVAYGRGGASRKALAVQDKGKKVEESDKPKSRAVALMSSMRKSDKSVPAPPKEGADTKTSEAIPAFGRGGFARKNKH